MPEPQVRIERDVEAGAAYIRLSTKPVASTVQVTEEVLVDLDDMGVAVGVEVLLLDAAIPYTRLVTQYHVHSTVIDTLRGIQPSVAGYLRFTSGADGIANLSAGSLQPV